MAAEKYGVNLIGRVIHGNNQITYLAFYPFVSGGILVEHHTAYGLGNSFSAMFATLLRFLNKSV